MIYKDFQGKKLSSLGLGCMRLPVIDGNNSNIDKDEVKKMVKYAMDNGINYYDTAWGYHDGMSELVMGEVLKEYPRDSFYIATKFPGYDLNNMDKVEEIFEKQLEKLQMEYFDFYLVHNVCEININQYLDPKYRIHEYLLEQKRNGRIKHLGFSVHGNMNTLKRFLEEYGKDMEFCQIQLNWLDYEFQEAKEKLELLSSLNIPIWVMEPVRGGALAKLEEGNEAKLKALRPNESMVSWAFRFLQTLPQVVVTLSGMSNFEQMVDNIATFNESKPLSQEEFNTLLSMGREMTSRNTLPCTKCRYCTTHCPMKLDIPWIIELYNEHVYSNGGFRPAMAVSAMKDNEKPSACLNCKACEQVCPQNIKISDMMKDFCEKLK